jgi:3D (Asp-Asp-Asp) domain-containing protein
MSNLIKILKNTWANRLEILVLSAVIFQFTFPRYALAAEIKEETSILLPNLVISAEEKASQNNKVSISPLIKEDKTKLAVTEEKVIKTYHIPVTAYSSTVDQCDSTPCITANGFDLCKHNQEDVIAANFLPFGTKVRMPEIYGDRIFTVQDRMNARYYYRADIWMKTRAAAVKFGLVYTTIEVLE